MVKPTRPTRPVRFSGRAGLFYCCMCNVHGANAPCALVYCEYCKRITTRASEKAQQEHRKILILREKTWIENWKEIRSRLALRFLFSHRIETRCYDNRRLTTVFAWLLSCWIYPACIIILLITRGKNASMLPTSFFHDLYSVQLIFLNGKQIKKEIHNHDMQLNKQLIN